MSTEILPEEGPAFKYVPHVQKLLAGCDPAAVDQVVAIVAALETALRRQAQDEIDIELRLTALEETLLRRLDEIVSALEDRDRR